jgi:hypothetical protein
MLRACVQRFDVTGNLKILAKFLASKRCLGVNHKSSAPATSSHSMSRRSHNHSLSATLLWAPPAAEAPMDTLQEEEFMAALCQVYCANVSAMALWDACICWDCKRHAQFIRVNNSTDLRDLAHVSEMCKCLIMDAIPIRQKINFMNLWYKMIGQCKFIILLKSTSNNILKLVLE